MKKVYTFYQDPGHGWLKVEKAELERLNILSRISGYSYQRGPFAYLEEDSDLSIFADAKRNLDGVEIAYRDKFAKNYSNVRNFSNFSAEFSDFKLVVQAGITCEKQTFYQKGETLKEAKTAFKARLSFLQQHNLIFVK